MYGRSGYPISMCRWISALHATGTSRCAATSRNITWGASLSTHATFRDLLGRANRDIDEHMSYLAIENFFEWFFDNIFLYHSSQIAEFLNNIRWAIFRYLQPEFARCIPFDGRRHPRFPRLQLPCARSHQPAHRPCDVLERHEPRPPETVDAALRHS